jgi:hypothetical protein
LQGVFITALYVLESFTQLTSALGHHFFKVLAVVYYLPFEMPLMESTLETSKDGSFPQRFDEIVVRARAHGLHTHIDVVHTRGDEESDVRIGSADLDE